MVRSAILPLLLVQIAAAVAQGARDPPLPVPPQPPPPPQMSAFQDAPVPNPAILPPAGGAGARAEVAPGVIEAPDTYRGETFRPGTSPADRDARLFTPAPGVTVRVPLGD